MVVACAAQIIDCVPADHDVYVVDHNITATLRTAHQPPRV